MGDPPIAIATCGGGIGDPPIATALAEAFEPTTEAKLLRSVALANTTNNASNRAIVYLFIRLSLQVEIRAPRQAPLERKPNRLSAGLR